MTQTILTNKKAFRDFFLTDKWECGIQLEGSEVKSIRAGHVNFKDAFARVDNGEIFLYNLHVDPYLQAFQNPPPDRVRKLLLKRQEINKIDKHVTLQNYLLVPTKLYLNNRGLVKVEIALGRGKKMYDKRETVKKRKIDRDIGRALRRGVRRK